MQEHSHSDPSIAGYAAMVKFKSLPKNESDNWMSAWSSICAAMTAQAAEDTGIYLLNMT